MEVVGAGQYPKSRPWKENADGARSVEQAIDLVKKWGMTVPSDVFFVVDEETTIDDPMVDAHYFHWRGTAATVIRWAQFFTINGQIPVCVRQNVFASDEAIVAVLAHELFEIQALRDLFSASGGAMPAERLHGLIARGIPGNLHDQAWNLADQLVEAMRKAS